jgi:hypothetical protein
LEELEKVKAAKRKGKRTDLEPPGNFPGGSTGEVRDIVGEALGGTAPIYDAAVLLIV